MEVMRVLWEKGSSTVSEVQKHLPPAKDLAYTTVQTVLNALSSKKKVRRTSKDAHISTKLSTHATTSSSRPSENWQSACLVVRRKIS
jgi:predicted transcriptional regulator